MEIPQLLKDIGHSTLEVISRNLANTLFAQLIEHFTPNQVHSAIVENVSLWGRWDGNMKAHYLEYGRPFKDTIIKNMDRITTETILTFMAEKGEPWSSQVEIIINTPEGPQWFDRQVEEIKRGIREYYYGPSNECT